MLGQQVLVEVGQVASGSPGDPEMIQIHLTQNRQINPKTRIILIGHRKRRRRKILATWGKRKATR